MSACLVDAGTLVLSATGFTVNEGTATTGTVATLTDSDTTHTVADFTAIVDWGDGTTETGTVSGGAGSFTIAVPGSTHFYADEGTYTYTVFVHDVPDNTDISNGNTATVTEADVLIVTMVLTAATENVPLPDGTLVAFLTDTNTTNVAADFTATLDWGDGTTTAGMVAGSAGSFTVTGGHTYADEGLFTLVVTVADDAPGTAVATGASTVSVAEADVLSGTGTTITPIEGQLFSGTVATFTDSNTNNVVADFTATIDWGDGTTTAGTVSGGSGAFSVSGSHTYAEDGSYATIVKLSDDAPGTATATANGTANVDEADLTASGATIPLLTEGVSFSGTVATFTDPGSPDAVSAFTATIDWGDGTTTAGTVAASAGSFSVTGTHTYADEGTFTVTTTVTETAVGKGTTTATTSATVGEGDALIGTGTTVNATEGASFSGTVATFTDSYTGNVAGDFSATIDWGDGNTTGGTVSGGSGAFGVAGTHTYAEEGTFKTIVTLSDKAPGTATATATSTANVSDAPLTAVCSPPMVVNDDLKFSGVVATFTDADPNGTVGDYTATIDWGDGSPLTAGTITANPGGGFDVSGSHTFLMVGQFTQTVKIADVGGSTADAVCTLTVVTPAPLLDPRGLATLVIILTGLGVLTLRRAS